MLDSLHPAGILRRCNRGIKDVEVEVDREYLQEIERARDDLRGLIISERCAPIMLRLAWQDAASYNWGAKTGGPDGSIRFEEGYSELKHAIDLCEEVKSEYTRITYADLYQLAGVVAVEVTGGPEIAFTPGRTDSTSCHRGWGSLRDPVADANVLRLVFYSMGFVDSEIVALLGAHTLGSAHPETSNYERPWANNPSKFDNSYFLALSKPETVGLMRLQTGNVLIQDNAFYQFVLRYTQDIDAFFESYTQAHRKFSELGYDFVPVKKWTMKNFISLLPAAKEKWTTKKSIPLLTASLIAAGGLSFFLYVGRKK